MTKRLRMYSWNLQRLVENVEDRILELVADFAKEHAVKIITTGGVEVGTWVEDVGAVKPTCSHVAKASPA